MVNLLQQLENVIEPKIETDAKIAKKTKVATMNQTTTTRLNPMTSVLHYNLLEAAAGLVKQGQNERYWAAVPVPKVPVGQVRYEVARQVSTFAVPLLGLLVTYLTYGMKAMLMGLPVAWFVGFVLDQLLQASIKAKLVRDMRIDAGRYRAVKYLSENMGMTPGEVTLPMVYKMAADFKVVEAERLAQEARLKAAEQVVLARRAERSRGNRRDSNGHVGQQGQVYGDSTNSRVSSDFEPMELQYTQYNPTTGLPMMPGSPLDVEGNVFGTGHM